MEVTRMSERSETNVEVDRVVMPVFDVEVSSEWHDKELIWIFSVWKMKHKISDKDLKMWLHSSKSGLEIYEMPHDGCIRRKHTDAYIEKALKA